MDDLVFENTKVILSQRYLNKMPAQINKTKFFEESVNSLNCTVSFESDGETYCFEGFWGEIVKAHDVLITALEKWSSGKQKQIDQGLSLKFGCASKIQHLQVSAEKKNISECKSFTHSPAAETPSHVLCQQSDPGLVIEADLDCSQTSEGSTKSEQLQFAHERDDITDSETEQPCLRMVSMDNSMKQVNRSRSTDEYNSQKCEALDALTVNELCVDIQLEHNYNHLRTVGKTKPCSDTAESAIENEIYMDIKLSNPSDKIFSNPDMPVTLVVAKEEEPGVEVVQLNLNKCDGGVSQRKTKFSSYTQEQLKLKKKKYEENAPYKYFCSQCSFKTKRHSHMRKHTRLHEKVCTIYSCEQCDFSTIRASHLQRHIGTHKTEVFTCSECTFSTHSEALLSKHQRYKHILKKTEEPQMKNIYQCLHCDYCTASEKIFERHLSVHSKKGKLKRPSFKCSKCAYQTPSRPNYLRHLFVHGDEKPFMCSTCGLCFKRSDTLTQHQVVHSELQQGESAFSCSQCKKCYRSASSLKDHLLTHEQDRRFLCEICAASFKTRAVQRKHFNEKHIHEKVHSCPSCSKSFTSKYLLKRHMKVHILNRAHAEETESQQISTVTNVWSNSLAPIQTPTDDVQVIVVHQEPCESGVSVQEGPLFQIASSLVPGQTLSVPIIPVEYVIPAADSR